MNSTITIHKSRNEAAPTYRVIDLIGYEEETPETDELMGYGIMAEHGNTMTMLPGVYGARSEAEREISRMGER